MMAKRTVFIAIFLIIIISHFQTSYQVCSTAQAQFPKIVGGTTADTYFHKVEYHPLSGYLVGLGNSKDQQVRGDTLGGIAVKIIAAYKAPQYAYQWGKSIKLVDYDYFSGAKINRLGTRIVIVNSLNDRYIIVLDIANGNLITATRLNPSIAQYHPFLNNLLILDSSQILMGDGSRIIIVSPPNVATTQTITGYMSIGLLSNDAQTYLHAFSYTASICMMTTINLATFVSLHQHQVQCQSAAASIQDTFQICSFEASATDQTLAFQEGTRFFRIRNNYAANTFTRSTVHDLNSPSINGKGLFCATHDLLYSLMYGTYQADFNTIFVAEVNFNTYQITYRRYLQQANFELRHGIIFGSSKFFIGHYQSSFKKCMSTVTLSKVSGLIYSSFSTCQQLDEYEYPPVSLLLNALAFTTSTITFASGVQPLIDVTGSLTLFRSLVSSIFENHYASQCSVYVANLPPQYTSLSSAQVTSEFAFAYGEASRNYKISPFTAVQIGIQSPIYTYSLQSFNNPATYHISINPIDGTISLNQISSLGSGIYSIVVQGKLQDCQTITASFNIKGEPNVTPQFATSLSDVFVVQGQTIDYELPMIIDPNMGQNIAISIIAAIGSTVPQFVDFPDISHTKIIVEPSLNELAGIHHAQISLYDGLATSLYPFNIYVLDTPGGRYNITNTGPPVFISPLETLSLRVGETSKYTVPSSYDPDGDKISINVNLGKSIVFVSYMSGAFEFKPAQKGVYEIEIILMDNNINAMSSRYQLLVVVVQKQIIQQNDEDDILRNTTTFVKFKLSKATRDGQLRLSILNQPVYVASLILSNFNESHFDLTLNGDKEISFQFSVDQISSGYLTMKIEFENPQKISLYDDLQDWVQLRANQNMQIENGTDVYTLMKNTQARSDVPNQYSEWGVRVLQTLKEGALIIQVAMIPGSILATLFLSALINLIWSMLNDLSIMISLTMISISIPGIAQSFMNIMLQFVYLDILQTDLWLKPFFASEKDDDGNLLEDEGLNEYFEQQGYQSMQSLKNLGSTLIFSISLIALFTGYLFFIMLGNIHSSVEKGQQYLQKKLFWNSSCRFIVQQYQPLIISSLINLYSLKFISFVTLLSSFFSFASLATILALYCKMLKAIRSMDQKSLKESWSPLVEGINTSTNIGRYWIPITLAKWTVLSFTFVVLRDYPSIQLLLITLLLLLSQALILIGRPYETPLENKLSLFNEFMTSLYLYCLYTLTDFMGRNELKIECGTVILSLVCITVGFNMLKVLTQASVIIFNAKKLKCKHELVNKGKVVQIKPAPNQSHAFSATVNASIMDDHFLESAIWHKYGQTNVKKTAPTSFATTMTKVDLWSKEMRY
ncbi:hypothetical protein FGO68_gene12117 [Halteria grandinella]|uniref:Cadherin domain-containing protein n=1 Tax=Halteria grandinella TaxID=5974 RepID=A0A8J8T8D0_HALGN|nr:hypothetical protein FGO68_gene12117 [Halteria grandinella]